jgi:hypothetical protein
MDEIRKILYVGAGYDTGPIIDFEDAEEFIYIDIMPRNVDSDSIPYNDQYCHGFVDKMTSEFDDLGFQLTETRVLDDKYHENILDYQQKRRGVPKHFNPTVFTFENEDKTRKIKYYASTNIERNMCDELSEDIADSDAIAVVGYSPNVVLFDHFKNRKTFIAYSSTCYSYFGTHDHVIGLCFKGNDDEVYNKYFNDIGYFLESHEEEYNCYADAEFPKTFNGTSELSEICAEINYRMYGDEYYDEDSSEESDDGQSDNEELESLRQ